MNFYGFVLAYLGAHFLAYTFVCRKLHIFQSEQGIFFFHAVSACFVLIAAAVGAFSSDSLHAMPVILGVAAMHGIYSLSFLELWSLSQGSYSREVVEGVLSGHTAESDVVASLAVVGDRKKLARLKGLETLCLLSVSSHGKVQLRSAGTVVSAGLRVLRWLANLHSTG